MKSFILTFVQYACLALMLYFSPWLAKEIYLQITQAIGGIIAIWAIIEMNKSKLNIAPNPRKGSVLIESGPYKLIRHPMYLSLILLFTPLAVSYSDFLFLLIYTAFTINLVFKLLHEESLLKAHFTDYKDYMKRSWRVFPYVY